MIWMLLVPVIGYFTFRDLYCSGFPGFGSGYSRNFLEWCFLLVVGSFITALLSLPLLGCAAFIGSRPQRTGLPDKDYPLVSLREKDGAVGRFFLGSGFVSDQRYYFWYRRDGDHVSGGKTLREAGVRIYTRNNQPLMRTYKDGYVNPMAAKYIWLVGLDMRDSDSYCPDFYIPQGSIKEGFQL